MREDESGVDTIFGALILIMVCLMTSSSLIVMEPSHDSELEDVQDYEVKYDCILSSTLHLEYDIGGIRFERIASVEKYAVELLDGDQAKVLLPSKNASQEISSLVDFYFGGFEGWSLRLNCSQQNPIDIASRGWISHAGESNYILSRSFIENDGKEASLDLIIFQ